MAPVDEAAAVAQQRNLEHDARGVGGGAPAAAVFEPLLSLQSFNTAHSDASIFDHIVAFAKQPVFFAQPQRPGQATPKSARRMNLGFEISTPKTSGRLNLEVGRHQAPNFHRLVAQDGAALVAISILLESV